MMKFVEKCEQKGTLLVEAIAMLGLIAMVTPTLYRKSAERMLELQDINSASQARIMNDVIESFVQNYFGSVVESAKNNGIATDTTKLSPTDGAGSGYHDRGYSSFLPFGYNPEIIKNYGSPSIYVHRDGSTLVSYIVYPPLSNPGRKRAARLASLVGANGGYVEKNEDGSFEFHGTGGAWHLTSPMIHQIGIDDDITLQENSLVVTSTEPIVNSTEDNDKYLYRGESPDSDPYHNTMVTDLFMGGHSEEHTDYAGPARGFYGIFNTKKLLMNTRCSKRMIDGVDPLGSSLCSPDIADLYIGKPIEDETTQYNEYSNNAAAWIYGNLNAVNDSFKVFKESSTAPRLVFGDAGEEGGEPDFAVIEADSGTGSARVSMLNDFVYAKQFGDDFEFLIGSRDSSDVENAMFHGSSDAGNLTVSIAKASGSVTRINEKGGVVWINGGEDSSVVMATTHVNTGGGTLQAGNGGEWLRATGKDTSSLVALLKNGGTFTVSGDNSSDSTIYADSSVVMLNEKRLQLYKDLGGMGSSAIGPYNAEVIDGVTTLATRYTDLLGTVFVGNDEIKPLDQLDSGANFNRAWRLGVAGSTWVDGLLWARQAWLREAGMAELHTGFSSFVDYYNSPSTGWLNVYGGSDGGVYIRNGAVSRDDSRGNLNDLMMLVDSSRVLMKTSGSSDTSIMYLHEDGAWIGKDKNFFAASSGIDGGVGSSLVVGENGVSIYTFNNDASSFIDIQNKAMYFEGKPEDGSDFSNKIRAKAKEFSLRTGSSGAIDVEDDVDFYVNDRIARTRYIDFEIQRNDSTVAFGVYPQRDSSMTEGSATIEMNGTVHITGNDVIHVASHDHNLATSEQRALFEVDPRYVRIWAKDDNGYASVNGGGDPTNDYFALVEFDTEDMSGAGRDSSDVSRSSIFVRKGAIELQKSIPATDSSSVFEADTGFGYIKANRFVSNTGHSVPNINHITGGPTDRASTPYDQYMVNPAYTSVMHDIKLTTRGNARLSDILPDFVLKGVYNVSNDYVETGSDAPGCRISWSAGDDTTSCTTSANVGWAHPFLGKIPYAMCPPGYLNMATVVPISFQIGRAGRAVRAQSLNHIPTKAKWQIENPMMQANILSYVLKHPGAEIDYTELEEVETFVVNDLQNVGSSFEDYMAVSSSKLEGWFRGMRYTEDTPSHGSSRASLHYESSVAVYEYGGSTKVVAEPLYFQEGTFLKTSLDNQDGYWNAYMGFLYNTVEYDLNSSDGINAPVYSNNMTDPADPAIVVNNYVWNLFPVPTNTLEGHATVYCYFDRNKFDSSHVLHFESREDSYHYNNKHDTAAGSGSDGYIDRLDDPSLKYKDPW